MLKQVFLAIIVGVVTALVVALIGLILVEVGLASIGTFVKGAAPLIGLLAGAWFYLTNQTPNRI